ncbi:FtsX-like permease family protein [Psychrobacillus sp. FSL K6-2836]|uniref:ABC transporter permease n=1 Tax=Psychrobacillus sp. FSL K6-2836 TaxID=2921548 RepID=UPI0030FB174B
MFSKIAINNVKRSFKDYSIYFLTLTFAVCIFYSFNSIDDQTAMLEMSKSTANFMATLNNLIAGTSIFVSFVLGGLIIYANNFLIKKRKKELGIYMTLGMSKRKISKIFIFETLLIGFISLAVGIIFGILVSQGMSVITAQLLAVDIDQYKFMISISAMVKSIVYFGIIFLLVMIFNQVTISKYKLIDMLNASKKNEEVKLSNTLVSMVIFILSVILLVNSYILIQKNGLNSEGALLIVIVLMGVIGTLLFFLSLSNFFIHIVQKRKRIYLKGLNVFILRQINNKINTNFLSMSAICLMLFLTITLLFTMFGYKGIYDKMLEGNTSFDASSWLMTDEEQKVNDIEEYLEIVNFEFEDYEKHSFYSVYELNLTLENLLFDYLSEQEIIDFRENYMDGPLSAMKISDYNSNLKLKGQEPIDLKDNEVLVVSNYAQINGALDAFMENENQITIENKIYTIKNDAPIEENILTTGTIIDFFFLIIPDSFTADLHLASTGFNVIYDESHAEKSEEKFSNLFETISGNTYIEDKFILVFGNTIDQVHTRVHGSTATIVFFGVYLGIIFLISSAAVLALQQLSDASESLERYKSLKKIGVTEKQINKAILIQTFIYFMVPLGLAIIHSIVGIVVVNEIFRTYSQSIIGSSLFMIAFALVIIYGGYFYATYVSFKNIVRNSN